MQDGKGSSRRSFLKMAGGAAALAASLNEVGARGKRSRGLQEAWGGESWRGFADGKRLHL